MSRRALTVLLGAVLPVAAPAAAHEPAGPAPQAAAPAPSASPASPAPTLHLRGGRWFDGERFRPMDWYAVGGKLTARRPARVDAVVDLSGRFVVPPLAEAHNHDLQNAWSAGRNAAAYVARGIFYTAQLCAMPSDVADYRGFLGTAAAPDVLFADACLSSSDGHPLGIALAGAKQAGMPMTADDIRDKHYWAVDTLADLDAKWPRMAEAEPKLVKVILIDSPNYAANRKKPELFGFNGMDPAVVAAVVERAHAAGARVAAHVDTGADFANAVAAGVDIVAHLPGYRIDKGKTAADYRIPDAAVAEAARRGVKVVTTTAASSFAVRRDPAQGPVIDGEYRDNIARLRAAGVELLPGSDMVMGSLLDEIDNLDRLGAMPRAELLRRATTVNARALFPGRDLGRFAEGAEASLVALPSDPLADLSALKRPALLVKRGRLLGGE